MTPINQISSNEVFDRSALNRLIERIRSASSSLLGDHPVRNEIFEVCDDYERRGEKATSNRSLSVPVIAVLGLKGQGKSWCVRSMLHDKDVRAMIPSGVLSNEATTKLYWVGPAAPEQVQAASEAYFHVDADSMLDLGFSYVLLDTPGTTDADEQASSIAKSAVAIAPVALMVTRQDQMRSAAVATLAHRAEGAIVLPIITAVSSSQRSASHASPSNATQEIEVNGTLTAQVIEWTDMLKRSAANTQWLPPVYVEDFEETGNETVAMERFQVQLQARLADVSIVAIEQALPRRVQSLRDQLRVKIGQIIAEQTPEISTAVTELLAGADRIPSQTIESILGSPLMLRMAIRNQLRARWISETPGFYFPYRTTMSILSLTQGAWDRVVLALAGSVPSLFGAMSTWTRNMTQNRQLQSEIKEGLHQRINAQLNRHLQPIHERFRHSLRTVRAQANTDISNDNDPDISIRLTGVEQLQIRSTEIFEEVIDDSSISAFATHLVGLGGCAIFWALFAGPIVAVYRDYLVASYHSLVYSDAKITNFPSPPATLFFTSILLSLLPLLIYCMFAMSFVLRNRRIQRIADSIMQKHHALIQEMRSQGLLRLDIVDTELRDAQFLIELDVRSVARSES